MRSLQIRNHQFKERKKFDESRPAYEPSTKSQKITTDKAKTSSPIVKDTKLQNIAPQIQKLSKNNSKKLQMTTGKSKAKTKAKAKANDNDKD